MPQQYSGETPLQMLDRVFELKDTFARLGGLAMIDLFPGDEISIRIGDDDNGLIQGSLLTSNGGGVLSVVTSSHFTGNISLGSYASNAGHLRLSSPGILRGLIQQDSFAVVDTAGKTFFNSESNNLYLPDAYTHLAINDIEFFTD